MPTTTAVGNLAENTALEFLKKQGLVPVERNFSCPWGEIDLIMRDGDILCFIEVRYRASSDHGSGADSITASKIRKILRTAECYLQERDLFDINGYQFDVVSIDDDIDWIREAFTADGVRA